MTPQGADIARKTNLVRLRRGTGKEAARQQFVLVVCVAQPVALAVVEHHRAGGVGRGRERIGPQLRTAVLEEVKPTDVWP